ncbi:unnamed protein product [Miscanthus lutarioriparius]|uniref:Uncharacterized protein n=1 Tax=Miscanthus lutarioriparius TaxID=422564 RepID=A0A811QBQ2_9POAL|nr:unnamed protein product [Miscanthus lutarioriparius]
MAKLKVTAVWKRLPSMEKMKSAKNEQKQPEFEFQRGSFEALVRPVNVGRPLVGGAPKNDESDTFLELQDSMSVASNTEADDAEKYQSNLQFPQWGGRTPLILRLSLFRDSCRALPVLKSAKNLEIARLSDRVQYYEAANREMSQRNQEAIEMSRQQR